MEKNRSTERWKKKKKGKGKKKHPSRSSDERNNAIDLDQFGDDEIAADFKMYTTHFSKCISRI